MSQRGRGETDSYGSHIGRWRWRNLPASWITHQKWNFKSNEISHSKMRYWPWTMTTVIERRADAEVWVTEKVTGVRIARRGWAPTEVAKLSQSMKWAHVTKWSANHDGFFKNVVIVCIILRRCQTSSSLFSTFLITKVPLCIILQVQTTTVFPKTSWISWYTSFYDGAKHHHLYF